MGGVAGKTHLETEVRGFESHPTSTLTDVPPNRCIANIPKKVLAMGNHSVLGMELSDTSKADFSSGMKGF